MGLADHRVAGGDPAVHRRKIVDRNRWEIVIEYRDAGEQLIVVADVVIAAREQLVDVVDLLVDTRQVGRSPGRFGSRMNIEIALGDGTDATGGDLIPGELPPSGSRSGVESEEKSPRRNASGITEAMEAASCFSRWPS